MVSFFNDLASEMVYPLLPALITTRLGAGAMALGALDGISDAVAAAVKLAAGRLADRTRWRRPLVVGGYAVATVARPLMAYASAASQVIALRATDRMGKGVRNPPRDAMIADAASPEIQGRAFGYHRSLDHAGAVVGPLIAWWMLSAAHMEATDVIAWSVVPGMLAVLVVVWATRSMGQREHRARDIEARESTEHGGIEDGRRTDALHQTRPTPLLMPIVIFAFARFPETLFLLRLQDLGVSVAVVPAVWALLHVVRSIGSYPGGWLSDRIGARRTMLLGWTAYAIVCLGLAVARTGTVASLWFLGFGAVAGLTEAPERAVVAAASPVARGTRFGIYHASVGVAALLGGLTFGMIYAEVGGQTALIVSAALAVAPLAMGTFFNREVDARRIPA